MPVRRSDVLRDKSVSCSPPAAVAADGIFFARIIARDRHSKSMRIGGKINSKKIAIRKKAKLQSRWFAAAGNRSSTLLTASEHLQFEISKVGWGAAPNRKPRQTELSDGV
jgi:hypothetical protein